jgi:hypothetical protein
MIWFYSVAILHHFSTLGRTSISKVQHDGGCRQRENERENMRGGEGRGRGGEREREREEGREGGREQWPDVDLRSSITAAAGGERGGGGSR